MLHRRGSLSWCLSQTPAKGAPVEIRIGIEHSAREITFESNQSAAEIETLLTDAFKSGVARFVDDRERVFLVNAEKITFLEIGEETQRRIGFVA